MIVPLLFFANPADVFSDFYFRLLACVAIINGTLTVLNVIFFKLYLQKHPEARERLHLFGNGKSKFWIWLIVIFFGLQIIPFLLFSLVSLFTRFD
jgi:hypothetical protein